MEYKKVDDLKTELFLKPIPSWITTYGFLGLLSISFAIIIFSISLKIPTVIPTKVHFFGQRVYTSVSVSEFSQVRTNTSFIKIFTPFENFNATMDIEKFTIDREDVIIPILLDSSSQIFKIPSQNEMTFKGEITVSDESIFQKVFHGKYDIISNQ